MHAWWLLPMLLAAPPEGAPPVLEIERDTVLDPAQTYGRLVIKASRITIDGRGAWLVGPGRGDPKQFTGTGISATGVSNVTLKNVNAKGWETGLSVVDGSAWRIENCNFSENFHDPSFGWGENGRRGGMVLTRVHKSVLRGNRANWVWDACVLAGCNDNRLEQNDFSYTSNTCLKLWNSSRNLVRKNNLSYGIRKDPGEVHARDSTSVLIESGSNDNRFQENDCTHGGDGIFIRVLNGWVSTGNVFEQNDCSYANNNCVEAWSPRNVYIGNKANHGSYGFWLGASDQTVLIDNEASHNGLPEGNHNSPHLPNAGHAGIVFMFGPSSHTIVRGNKCVGNNGAGIAVIGDLESSGRKWKAFHWIIEQNLLAHNRWGIYAQHADWLDVAGNVFRANRLADFENAGNVTNLRLRDARPGISLAPTVALDGPALGKVGVPISFSTAKSKDPAGHRLEFRWDLGDGTISEGNRVEHVYQAPGFYRLGVTGTNGLLSDLAWRDLYIVEDLPEPATEGQAGRWTWDDPSSQVGFSDDRSVRIAGHASIHALAEPYGGGRLNLVYPASRDAGWSVAGKRELVFWFKAINEHVPAWQDVNPVITLFESPQRFVRLVPSADLLSRPVFNEAREGWNYFAVPLAGNEGWKREGGPVEQVNWLSIGVDSWGAPPLRIWLDGLALK